MTVQVPFGEQEPASGQAKPSRRILKISCEALGALDDARLDAEMADSRTFAQAQVNGEVDCCGKSSLEGTLQRLALSIRCVPASSSQGVQTSLRRQLLKNSWVGLSEV